MCGKAPENRFFQKSKISVVTADELLLNDSSLPELGTSYLKEYLFFGITYSAHLPFTIILDLTSL